MREESYQLTVKGWLYVRLMPHFTYEEVEKIWSDLSIFVAEQAEQQGHPEGVPTLVLDGSGGCCMTCQRAESLTPPSPS